MTGPGTTVCLFGGSETANSGLLMNTAASMPLYCLDYTVPNGAWTTESSAGST